MVRSILIISLAIVCGAAAAIGVNQALRQKPEEAPVTTIATEPVLVAVRRIGRGEVLAPEMIREVQWPADLVPTADLVESADDAVDRVVLSSMMEGEPLFASKLTSESGEGFIASIIKPGRRAYTIQTRGPSGFRGRICQATGPGRRACQSPRRVRR